MIQDRAEGQAFITNLLRFWQDRLTDCLTKQPLSKEEKKELDIIEGLLHSDAPYRLWEECQSGIIRKDTIHEVEKVDVAIFKLKFRILPLPDSQRERMDQFAKTCESILVYCICNGLRKEGRLVE